MLSYSRLYICNSYVCILGASCFHRTVRLFKAITEHELMTKRTCGRGRVAGGGWRHAVSMTTERHQAGDDGRFAEAHVADDHDAPTGRRVAAPKTGVHFLEEPLPAGEQPIGREARHLEVEGLQVEGRSEADCGGGEQCCHPVGGAAWSRAACLPGGSR